ncbi:MAG TPA: DUF2306 domain-containing protein, partial [Cyclobacteriaceae bacterium]|nr:DUF2306 domain-containing protein [Cyclobacteriaceae bacterium]
MRTLLWSVFIFFAVAIGFYPFAYLFFDMRYGLLASKPPELLQSEIWYSVFYLHIFLGSIAILSGWSQFSKRIRNKNLTLHRTLGKIYLTAVALSGVAALYIAFFATGGIVSVMGFAGLAIGWLLTSAQAYRSIRGKNVDQHQYWMIRSYALCWAAVTLRIWLPLFQFGFGVGFLIAYRIIAWLCWV